MTRTRFAVKAKPLVKINSKCIKSSTPNKTLPSVIDNDPITEIIILRLNVAHDEISQENRAVRPRIIPIIIAIGRLVSV